MWKMIYRYRQYKICKDIKVTLGLPTVTPFQSPICELKGFGPAHELAYMGPNVNVCVDDFHTALS